MQGNTKGRKRKMAMDATLIITMLVTIFFKGIPYSFNVRVFNSNNAHWHAICFILKYRWTIITITKNIYKNNDKILKKSKNTLTCQIKILTTIILMIIIIITIRGKR